jgi:SAM-dependent methyltransferase
VSVTDDPVVKNAAAYYELPYRVFGPPGKVAIVGAGTGNDVAAALRCGAEQVDAIEIDPVILRSGRYFHPEKPYQDPRVHCIVNDARTFLRNTNQRYDMVVYGLLDSHTLLSHASSVRLDSFVYTVEALKEARQRLKDGGVLSLSFCVLSPELGRKIYLMMQQAFGGRAPVCVRAGYDDSVVYLQAKGHDLHVDAELLRQCGFEDATPIYGNQELRADVSTDDWPFFYMPQRIYPSSYIVMMALIAALSVAVTANFAGGKMSLGHAAFFFLGAGFMLVETKGITELGLTFGNTWHVIGVVICGILLMGFLANSVVRWVKFRRPWLLYALLVATLALGYVISRSGGLGSTLWGRIGTVAVLTAPMFASGLVFSSLLRSSRDVAGALASNLLGAMFGGILEYNSMYFGFRFLYLLAIGLYLAALLSSVIRRRGLTPASTE